MRVTLSDDERFLEVDLESPQRTLSWAIVGAGFGVHRRVVWHFVRREELSFDIDPEQLLRDQLKQRGYEAAVGLLTARHLRPYADQEAVSGDVVARAIVTVGLGNALRAGDPPVKPATVGTINVLCQLSVRLSDTALIEAIALASEARTLALHELRYPSAVSELPASGTGTDCIVIACPSEGPVQAYAGKHTDVGAALGRSVHTATRHATQVWLTEQGR